MEYLNKVIHSINKDHWSFIVFCIVGLIGMIVHWAKKWLKDETTSNLFAYLFVNQGKYTALSILTYFGAIAGILAIGVVDYTNSQSLAISFLAGYMIDSAINKDAT